MGNTLCPECGHPLVYLGFNRRTNDDEHLCLLCGSLIAVHCDEYAAVFPAWVKKGGSEPAYNVSFSYLLVPTSVY